MAKIGKFEVMFNKRNI